MQDSDNKPLVLVYVLGMLIGLMELGYHAVVAWGVIGAFPLLLLCGLYGGWVVQSLVCLARQAYVNRKRRHAPQQREAV